jgi:tetraacyldisaccharide 4'-kinase
MDFILTTFSKVYSSLMRLRGYLYEKKILASYKSKFPVISIGNISAGGTGKTPLCIFLAKAMKEKGYSPVVLSRGYKGNYSGVHLVNRTDEVKICGDEPLLIADKVDCPVVLSRDRIEGAKFIEDNNLGNLIILDDALQHIRLKRDIDIVTINISSQNDIDDILSNRILPFGHLREDRDQAMNRSDFVVLSSRMPQSKAKPPGRDFLKIIPANKVIVSSYFEAGEIISCSSGEKLDGAKEAVVFCAIANPESFYATLESLGINIKERVEKRDHYVFTAKELESIKRKFKNIPIICTEKDAVRIPQESKEGIYKLTGEIKIIPEDAFLVQIEKKLKNP